MFKKIFVGSVLCVLSCGVAFAAYGPSYNSSSSANSLKRMSGALSFAENSLRGFSEIGIGHICLGDDKESKCKLDDIDLAIIRAKVKNAKFEVSFDRNNYKQRVSADIVLDDVFRYDGFVPKSLECNSTYDLNGVDIAGGERCVIKSEVASLDIDISQSLNSQQFTGRNIFEVFKNLLTKTHIYNQRINALNREYSNATDKLDEEKYNKIDKLYDTREHLEESYKKVASKSCGCKGNKGYDVISILSSTEYLEDSLASNEKAIKDTRKEYERKHRELKSDYQDELKVVQKELVKWLDKYEFDISKIRIHVRGDKLADSTFALYARDSLKFSDFNDGVFKKPSKGELKKRMKEKKKVNARYYSSIESSRAIAISFVNNSEYLSDSLKKKISKIISENVKLFEPYTNKKSVRILATHTNPKPFNLGKEIEKIIDYSNDKTSDGEFLRQFFDIVNEYDIRVVKYFRD